MKACLSLTLISPVSMCPSKLLWMKERGAASAEASLKRWAVVSVGIEMCRRVASSTVHVPVPSDSSTSCTTLSLTLLRTYELSFFLRGR